jgi:hypothetical protein
MQVVVEALAEAATSYDASCHYSTLILIILYGIHRN